MSIRLPLLTIALLAAPLAALAATPTTPADMPQAFTVDGARVMPTEFNGDLRRLPKAAAQTEERERYDRRLLSITPRKVPPLLAPSPQPRAAAGPNIPAPAPLVNFPGISRTDMCAGGQCGAGIPPDPNGDVGLNHYIQAVNSAFVIYAKSGSLVASFTEDQLWSAAGTPPCSGNSQGDPVVLYDAQANRWILTQFAFPLIAGDPTSPFYQCIAVSKTSDPVSGGWFFYALRMDSGLPGEPPVGAINDYPKFGIWSDCLYMSANEFQFPGEDFVGTLFASFSRADMYAGKPLTWAVGFINNTTGPYTMLPSNLSGRAGTALPPGTPNYFVSESTTDFAFEVRKFLPGANCGGGGSLGPPAIVSQSTYDPSLLEAPQPNTTNKLDSLFDRLMQKAQYRKIGNKESLWVVHTVQAAGRLAPHWAQIDVTGGVVGASPVQEQIFAPDAVLHRWMGSLAVDGQGNMALGYSTSGSVVPNFPSIAYAGRLVTDPLNQLPQSETQLIAGNGSQTNNCAGAPCDRWGDYSAMSVDPVDDCTFWYTNEYYSSQANGATGNWQTRIGSFKFPGCSVLPSTTTALASSGNPSLVGFSVTFTATVTGITPTGFVKFDDGGSTIAGCASVALTGSGNARTAACSTSSLIAGSHVIGATYTGDVGNGPSNGVLTQVVSSGALGNATVVRNPYGALSVQGGTLVGNTISNLQSNAVIQLGSILPPGPASAEIDFQGLNLAAGSSLTIRSGAPGQFVYLVNTDASGSAIAGTLQAQGGNGALPPALYVKNLNGFTLYAGGSINSPSGLGVDTSAGSFNVAQPIVNAGTIDGGSVLELVASRINGGGAFRGNAIVVHTFGSANNPVNGAFFLSNGLQLFPGSGNNIALTLNAYGSTPQFLNLQGHGEMSVWMPSAWPSGSTLPVNSRVVAPSGVRGPGVPDPSYGGGSMIVQSTGSITLVNGGTNDFVFPGGIVFKAGTSIDTAGVLVNQGWTTSGQAFQGTFFEAPMIRSSTGFIQSYTSNLNWVNFSTFPATPVRAFQLTRNGNGSAQFFPSDAVTPHLNTYSVQVNAAAMGQCWTCLVNPQPVNMFGP